jgi:hypothetical protein
MARISLGALVLGALLMLSLHVVPPTDRISPIRRTLSEYALGPNKWIFDLSVLLIAAGSALLFTEAVRRRLVRPLSLTVLFGTVWTVSLLFIVAFTKTNWAIGPSVGGVIHRYASLAAYLSLPVAVLLFAGAAFHHSPVWRRSTRALAILTLLCFGLILAGVINMYAGDGRPWWRFLPLGLVERAVAFSAATAVITAALGLVLRRAPGGHSASATNQTPTAGSVPSLR